MATTGSVTSHYVFQNNPTELRKFLYKEVEIDVYNEKKERGWVFTIDPVSGSVVLVNFVSNQPKNYTIVLGHSVKNITVTNDNVEEFKLELDRLSSREEDQTRSPAELQERKEKVKNWLNKNRIPFEEKPTGELNIMDALTLSAPYNYSNCTSANTIVLGKVQGLIKAMPSDVEEW